VPNLCRHAGAGYFFLEARFSMKKNSNQTLERATDNQISSADLAAIIVDALLDVGILQKKDVPRHLKLQPIKSKDESN
jgi:hypothetical protein